MIYTMILSKLQHEKKSMTSELTFHPGQRNKCVCVCVCVCWPAVEQVLIDGRAEASCLTKLVKTLS